MPTSAWPLVMQAPTGSITCPALAAAVSNSGGLGHLALTWTSPDRVRRLVEQTRRLTDRPFGANFVLDFPIEAQLDACLAAGAPIVSFFWGDGSEHLPRVRAAGATAVQVVGSVADAERAARAGFDLIVAQGREAGGHVCGEVPMLTLVRDVVRAVGPTPVAAAGGVADLTDVQNALAAGASAVWVGTAFLAAEEANIHPTYQALVLAADGDQTCLSTLFDIGWPNAPMRTLRNSTWRRWEAAGRPAPGRRPGETDAIATRAGATEPLPRYHFAAPTPDMSGEIEAMALYAGAGVGRVRQRRAARDIVRALTPA